MNTLDWIETQEPHPLVPEERFRIKVMIKSDKKMVVDKATAKWFKYGPEEFNRQFEEQYLHDDFDYPWSRIKPEAPIKMGSETRYADIVVLRKDGPIEPSNYLEVIEVKQTGGDLEGGRAQLISYMTNSNAFRGILSDVQTRVGLFKTAAGKIIEASATGKSAEDLLSRADLKSIHVDRKRFAVYCKEMRNLLVQVPQDSIRGRAFVAFWLTEVRRIEKVGQRSGWD